MARTRSSVAAKVSVGKSSKVRCSPAPSPSFGATAGASGGDRSSRSSSGGNPVCPRETPKWQKPITSFLKQNQTTSADDEENIAQAGSSKSKPKRNVINSDDEEENTSEKPDTQTNDQSDTQTDEQINKELDETIELGPLTGEDSHKIDEYYCKKNKGKGKKSKKYKKDVGIGNIGEDTDKETVGKEGVLINDTKHVDENINGQNKHDKENINMNSKDTEEIDKNDLDNEKNKDMQIEVLDKEDMVKGNVDKENMNSKIIKNKQDTDKENKLIFDKENKDIEKEHNTDSEINKNDLDIEKTDNKENGNGNSIRNKRHLDELNAEDERHCKKIKVD